MLPPVGVLRPVERNIERGLNDIHKRLLRSKKLLLKGIMQINEGSPSSVKPTQLYLKDARV